MGLDRSFNFRNGISVGKTGIQVVDGQSNVRTQDLSSFGHMLSGGVNLLDIFTTDPSTSDSSLSTFVSTNSAYWNQGGDSYTLIQTNSAAWLSSGSGGVANTIVPAVTGTQVIAPMAYVAITTAGYGSGINVEWTRDLFTYNLEFTSEQPDTDYLVLTDNEGRDDVFMSVENKTVSGFTIKSFDDDGDILRPEPTSVIVYGSSPLFAVSGASNNTGGGSGGAATFVTDVECSGLTQLTKDATQIAVAGETPVLSAVVDDPVVTFTLQWEGGLNNWTDYPSVSGNQLVKNNSSVLNNQGRRFEGEITLDLTQHAGQSVDIPFTFENTTKYVNVSIAGAGPVVTNLQITSSPQHGQDHYKDGDNVTFVVEFDTTDVDTISLEGGNNYATGSVNDLNITMNGLSATVTTAVDTTLTTKQAKPIRLSAKNSFGTAGGSFTSSDTAQVMNGPVITGVTFGTYPTTFGVQQTELKDNDQVSATFTFDTTNVNRIALQGGGNNSYANTSQTVTVNTNGTTSATATITVDTTLANNTGGFARPVLARAYKNGQHGSSNNFTSSNTLQVNNQAPTFSSGSITYPPGQSALKDVESATVNVVVNNQGGNSAQYTYSSPNNQLSINNTGSYAANKTATRSSGDYNINTTNYRLVVNRVENGRSATKNITVFIAHVAPTINIVTNNGTRMRSGGNDNTSQQNYDVVITSTQRLKQAPTLTAPHGTLGSFSFNANSTSLSANMGVHDNNTKGTHTFTGLNAIGLAGKTQNNVNTGADYVFGGFVSRTVDLVATLNETDINVLWVDYTKLTFSWSKNSDVTIRAAAGTTTQITNNWCILSQTSSNTGTPGGPVTVKILDFSKANAATVDSEITMEETI